MYYWYLVRGGGTGGQSYGQGGGTSSTSSGQAVMVDFYPTESRVGRVVRIKVQDLDMLMVSKGGVTSNSYKHGLLSKFWFWRNRRLTAVILLDGSDGGYWWRWRWWLS
jgi:hypothetical protein